MLNTGRSGVKRGSNRWEQLPKISGEQMIYARNHPGNFCNSEYFSSYRGQVTETAQTFSLWSQVAPENEKIWHKHLPAAGWTT